MRLVLACRQLAQLRNKLCHTTTLLSDRSVFIVDQMDNKAFHSNAAQNAKNKQPKPQKFVQKLPTLDPSATANIRSVLEFPFNDRRVRLVSTQRSVHVGSRGVVYWMSRDQRVQDNWAFLYAQKLALEHKLPLHVCFCLVPKFLEATIRHFGFMLKGLEEVEAECRQLGIAFHLLVGYAKDVLPAFITEHDIGGLVTDFSPLRVPAAWVHDVKSRLPQHIPFFQVDAHNIVPCWEASMEQEMGAMTIRGKLHSKLPTYFTEFPPVIKHVYPPKSFPKSVDWVAAEASLEVDRSVGTVAWATPGTKAGLALLADFIDNRLTLYALSRNDPNVNAQSNLAPYFHFGQVSAQRVVIETNQQRFRLKDSVEWFMEQTVIRQELSDNFCFYNHNYDSFDSTHDWARESLMKHSTDPREYVYSRDELENAKTHDVLWNACQIQLVQDGKIHGYMRMYWAKKILEWTTSPQVALADCIYLNDKYSLDGRDPNGYVAIMWSICGLHDKNFPERAVFGKVRYMSYHGCKGKFDVPGYVNRFKSLKRAAEIKPQVRQYSTQKQPKEELESQPWESGDTAEWGTDASDSWDISRPADDMTGNAHVTSPSQSWECDTHQPGSGRNRHHIETMGGGSSHIYDILQQSDMDVLRPALVRVGNRVYRKTPILQKEGDVVTEDYERGTAFDEDVYCDEICDINTNVEETSSGYRIRLDAPSAFYKFVIGKKGDTKKKLETETRTEIQIPKTGEEGQIVISGRDRKGVVSAKTRIEILIDSARQRMPFTHFLSIPMVSEKIKDRFAEFKTDVLLNCTDRGLDGKLFQNVQKLHLTLGTLVLVNQSEVDKALVLLQDCRDEYVTSILKGQPLDAQLSGLEYMNDDPAEVDVLYAKVKPQDGTDKLQRLADNIVSRFTSSGMMQQQYDRVKIHATVMNTLFRMNSSQQDRQKDTRTRETFDASNLLQIFNDYDFGDIHINTIHLSERYSTGPDGYYSCAGKINL